MCTRMDLKTDKYIIIYIISHDKFVEHVKFLKLN